jgi:hypothetical protein
MKIVALLALACCLLFGPIANSAAGCPLNLIPPPSWRQETQNAKFVFVGKLVASQKPPENGKGTGSSEFLIEEIITGPAAPQLKNRLVLPRYIPIESKESTKRYLVFCDVEKGILDPYRGEIIPSDLSLDYLKRALKLDPKDLRAQFDYFLPFLDSPVSLLANDAGIEMENADQSELLKVVEKRHVKLLRKIVRNPSTGTVNRRLAFTLLSKCGDEQDAIWLAAYLESRMKPAGNGSEQMAPTFEMTESALATITVLKPSLGWQKFQESINNPKLDFMQRYGAMKALRFLHDNKQVNVDANLVVNAMLPLLEQADIADLAMENFRRWKRFDVTEKVLALYDRKSHDVPIMKRAIVRFALSAAPTRPSAAEFIERLRKEAPERVQLAEETLALEPKQ